MNYAEAVAYIESLAPTILNPSLDRFSAFMQERGNPQDSFASLHVAGTNGKGSVVAILDSVLRADGLRVGRFTGPHLLRWNERFHFEGQPISDSVFAELATELRELSEDFGKRHPELGHLTWFEFLTALSWEFFRRNKVDIAVVEVGLGGRWDATNVLHTPLVSSITTIDFDHTHILGGTLPQIAAEKAGIIKPGTPVVTGATGDALATIRKRAEELGAPLFLCTAAPDTVKGPTHFDVSAYEQVRGKLALAASYQELNGLLAWTILQIAQSKLQKNLSSRLQEGFERVYWPGRFQFIPSQSLLLDGAHNIGGARALRASLDSVFAKPNRIFVLSYFENKDVSGSLKELLRPGDRVFASTAKTTRAVCPAQHIVDVAVSLGCRAQACTSIADAFASAQQERQQGDLIIATGSFATIKETMQALGWRTVEDGRDQSCSPFHIYQSMEAWNSAASG